MKIAYLALALATACSSSGGDSSTPPDEGSQAGAASPPDTSGGGGSGSSDGSGSGSSDGGTGSAGCVPPPGTSAPTYTQLYATYFATGTAGHCANGGCHGAADYHVWLCGDSAASCYQGMVGVGLVDPTEPTASLIADPANSPLVWVNPDGPMPLDSHAANPAGRDAITAWVAACAPNN